MGGRVVTSAAVWVPVRGRRADHAQRQATGQAGGGEQAGTHEPWADPDRCVGRFGGRVRLMDDGGIASPHPERIALISDVHGNLTALEAVLADIDARGITRIFNLGDYVGKGHRGREVVDLCRERCEVNILGNWDDFLPHPGREFDNDALQWWLRPARARARGSGCRRCRSATTSR